MKFSREKNKYYIYETYRMNIYIYIFIISYRDEKKGQKKFYCRKWLMWLSNLTSPITHLLQMGKQGNSNDVSHNLSLKA